MLQPNPSVKFTVDDYMATPEGTRYELLDGELIMAAAPSDKHQAVVGEFYLILQPFVRSNRMGIVRLAPYDVVLSDHDVAQPDILFVSNERLDIRTAANLQGAPDLAVEVSSPSTARYDRGYKLELYARHGVREYWIVEPFAETVEVYVLRGDAGLLLHASYSRGDTLTSPLLPGLAIDLEQVFAAD